MPSSELRRSAVVGSAILFAISTANLLPFSFSQSQRDLVDCGPLCYGYLQSFTSAMSFIGAILVGHLSDSLGRSQMLYYGAAASAIGHAIAVSVDSSPALFLAAIPASFNQNHAVMKALVSDWLAGAVAVPESERASYMGYLGMAAGLSFMVGPLLGAAAFSSFRRAKYGAIAGVVVSSVFLSALPAARRPLKSGETDPGSSTSGGKMEISSFSNLRSLFSVHTPGAALLLGIRMCMGLAYSVYNGVFMTSLKTRFDFSPMQYGALMAWVGLSYSLAQGFGAKRAIRWFNDDVRLLLTCAVVLGLGRALQMHVMSVYLLYVIIFLVISALGTMNTLISTATTQVAANGSVGGLFGSMEAAEKLASLFGPAIGGILFNANPFLPTAADIVLYAVVFLCILLGYRQYVIDPYVDSSEDRQGSKRVTPADSKLKHQ